MKRFQWLRRGSLVLSACLSALGVLVAGSANAGTYYEEQGQLVRASKSVKALGPDLFGDKVNHYNGALEFVQPDISLPGNSELAVSVGRRFNPNLTPGYMNGLFGRWDLEIPRIQGVFASAGFVNGWGATDRCSRFSAPPPVTGAMAEGAWQAKEYWHGNMLYIPGGGEKEILLRTAGAWPGPSDGQTYGLLTKDNWALRCIALASGGGDGEGFMALSPSGVRYQFDWMASRQASTLARSTPYSDTLMAGAQPPAKAGLTPMAADGYYLRRTEVWILPTKITDRFGNWVRFTYDPVDRMRVLSIESSDGRKLSFSYQESPRRIKTVSVITPSDGSRTWTYHYATGGDLASVVLPDQSRWTFALEQFFMTPEGLYLGAPASCPSTVNGLLNKISSQAIMTHPSGAVGTFVVEPVEHARGSDDITCATMNGGIRLPQTPAYFAVQAVKSKTLSGPGLPTQTWNYSYSSPTGEGSYPGCTYCPSTKWMQVQEPNGRSTRMTHGMKVGVNEGLLLKTEDFDAQGSLLRTVSQSYRAYDAGPYPQKVGSSIINFGDGYLHGRLQPLQQRVITQQGQNFSWTVATGTAGFDSWARVLQVSKSGPGGSRTDTTAYKDLPNLWVMGLTESVTATGYASSVFNDYDTLGRKTADKAFGIPQFTYGYNADGTLAWKKDGRNNSTSYSNYKLGLPQLVSYADGSSESVTVDGLGQITSHRSAASYTTGYGYDAMGRLNLVTPPSGFTPTSLVFEPVGGAEYGVPAGHWRQTVTKGNAKTITVLDALWRPVMTRTFDASQEANTRKVVVKGYDLGGQLSFESYPARDYGTVALTSPGKRMSYDALGRLTLVEQDSELGVLKTRQDYQSGFATAVTNPRGKVTTQRFWALDNPAEASLAQADMPEGVQLLITRDALGKPTAISRGGVTRRYVYDAFQRLCKTLEPEINATIQDYDAAGNIAWRAPGQNLSSTSSCDTAGAQAAARISYSYDALNQLTGASYGDGSPAITRSYWPDGKLKTVDSNGSSWSYTYNALRDISTETLSYGGQIYGFSWGYDASGSLSSLTYPGSATSVSYVPNALGEPSQVGGFASALTFHPNGAVNTYRLGNGVQHTMTPNLRGLPAVNQDTGVLNDAYTYDANGNVVSITDQQGGGAFNRSMAYDDLDRLKTVSAPGVWGMASYTYDAADNLKTANVGSRSVTLNYTDGTNRLNSLTVNGSTSAYSYDAYGNIRSKGAQTYSFDLGNRLSASSLGGGYVYDGLGRRIKVSSSDGSTRISVYSQAGQLLWSTSTGGSRPASTTAYVYLGGKAIAEVNSVSGTQYVHTDALGSPAAHTGASGSLLNTTRFEPYGAVAQGTKPGPATSLMGYTGHVQDPETDLVYMQQRYYDPIAGRFLSVDPIVTDANTGRGFGRYTYVGHNPYRYVDPDGLDARDDQIYRQLQRERNRACSPRCDNETSVSMPSGQSSQSNTHASSSSGLSGSSRGCVFFCLTTLQAAQRDTTLEGAARAGELFRSFTAAAIIVPGSVDALSLAGSPFLSSGLPAYVTVTSWAPSGTAMDLAVGRWVVVGGPTTFNFIRTGLGGPTIAATGFHLFRPQSSFVSISANISSSNLMQASWFFQRWFGQYRIGQ